jgi:hypothetical protein
LAISATNSRQRVWWRFRISAYSGLPAIDRKFNGSDLIRGEEEKKADPNGTKLRRGFDEISEQLGLGLT